MMNWVALAVLAGATTVPAHIGCAHHVHDHGGPAVTTPADWRPVTIGDAAVIAVPPDATPQPTQPVDSVFGVLRGPGYEIVYDYGRYGERLTDHAGRPGYTHTPRTLGGRPGTEVTYRGDGDPWVTVRIAQAPHDDNTLTIRMACARADTCRQADHLFDSVDFT